MDASIGTLIDALEQKDILDHTIIVFFSDNGGSGGADNSPLKGKKGQTWEGGIRVPCLIRWPDGNVPAGEVKHEFLTSLELFPSFAAATGELMRDDLVLDGFDWWPVIRDDKQSPRSEMFWKRKDQVGARVGKWKWVEMGGKAGGLFDLESDVGEQHDLSKEKPEVLEMVKKRYAGWLAEMADAAPRGPFRDF